MSLVPSSDYWRFYQHLSSTRGPLFLYQPKPNSTFVLRSMKHLHGSVVFYPLFPCRTVDTSLISVNQSEPKTKFILNCVKHTEFRSTRSVVYRRKGLPATIEQKRDDEVQEWLISLREKLYKAGIQPVLDKPGQFVHLECPKCLEGDSKGKSLYLRLHSKGNSAVWKCFNTRCSWTGYVQAHDSKGSTETGAPKVNAEVMRQKQSKKITEKELKLDPLCHDEAHASKVSTETGAPKVNAEVEKQKQTRKITEKELKLEPLCNELLAFFKSRGIYANTLRRNGVMQKPTKDGPAIAFVYWRDEALVNCKYRRMPKIFWQEAGTEKILYGLDDIKNESEIIIVEGEIDKLSMEEAGFRNCVSVPNGAPLRVSNKEIPSQNEDIRYRYLWTCKEYLKSASRIILATDADNQGKALAEELARRLGKERCWVVKWPMRNDDKFCKDANEVLCYKGKKALREVIENAENYPI